MPEENNRLKELRMELGYTQTEFAARLNVSKTLISKIEIGAISMSPKLIKKIAVQFSLSEDWLNQDEWKESLVTNERRVSQQMYNLIKYNFHGDARSSYLINNAIFDIIDTTNMSEDNVKEYTSYICDSLVGIAIHFKEVASQIRKENF